MPKQNLEQLTDFGKRLQRRFQQVEKLPAKERRQLVQVIDTYLQAAQIKQSA